MSRKDDAHKLHPSYILSHMPQAFEAVLEVAEYGAKKYSPNGWKEVTNAQERYKEALLRHVLTYAAGHTFDEESKMQHLAHAAWNCLAIMQLTHIIPAETDIIPDKLF